jgi:hypothetical protein
VHRLIFDVNHKKRSAIDEILPVFKRALSLSKLWYDQTKNHAQERRWAEDFQAIERKLLRLHEKFLPHLNMGWTWTRLRLLETQQICDDVSAAIIDYVWP